MSLSDLITRAAEHNAWANSAYIEWLSGKDEEVLVRDAASSCPTILATFKHIWEAQEFWTGVLGGTDEITRVWELTDLSKTEIFEGLAANSRIFANIVAGFSDDDLATPLAVKNQWLDCALPRAEYIQQIVTHGSYHRGQIVTMARGFGITDPPMTDFIAWAIR